MCRVKQIVNLVYTTIREPHYTLDLPLAVARLLAIPREKIFKTVCGIQHCLNNCSIS